MSTSMYRVALLLGVAALASLPQEKEAALKLPQTQPEQAIAISNQVTTEASLADEVILSNLLEELPLTSEQRADIFARLGVELAVSLGDEARTLAKSNTDAGAAQLARAEELIGVAETERTRSALDQAQAELNLVSFSDTAKAQERINALSASLAEEERLAAEQAEKAAAEAAAQAAQQAQAAQAAQQAEQQAQAAAQQTQAADSSPALGSVRLSNGNTAGPVGIEAARIMEQRTGVPATTWELIIARESNGNPNAANPSGARGLFQTMPFHGSTATVADQIEAAVRAYNAQGLSAWGM